MAGDKQVVLDTTIFHLSRAKQTTDAIRRKFTANLQGIVTHLPRICSAKTQTPRQRLQHHRRGITTPELQSSYHGVTTRMKSVFNSLARKVDIKVLPQKSNRNDSTRATVDGRLPKLTRETPLRMRVGLRKSESNGFSNHFHKVSFTNQIHEDNDDYKWSGVGMLQRVGDARCCNQVICRCFCQHCDLKSGRHCVKALGQGHRAGHLTQGQRTIANVKQNFVSDANIYFPFSENSPRSKQQQHVQNNKGSKGQEEDLRAPPEYDTLWTLKLRALLPVVEEGSQVLFRSPDDGWYYAGTVSRDCRDYMYIVNDGYGQQELVWREDIISDLDRKLQVTVGQKVVTQHPRFAFSYAPGEVVAKEEDKVKVKVKLYDGKMTDWTFDFAPLSKPKYDNDVTYIAQMRKQWFGQSVLARVPSGLYEFGEVSECLEGHRYKVKWTSPGGSSIVDGIHLFGALTPYREIQTDGHVLAPLGTCYLPAKVTFKYEDRVTVTFVENSEKEVEESYCFWISPSYYYDAVAVYFNARVREGDGEFN